jgi:tRNA pseudouridine65 synthase
MELEIIYRDEHIVAINKPHGLLVHRSPIAAGASEFALQILRDQLGQRVYPAHRIDRKTSGILLFALQRELLSALGTQFAQRTANKQYLAVVRGWLGDNGLIDYGLFTDAGVLQDAQTTFRCLGRSELLFPSGANATSRYSLALAEPHTGRMHQLRKHFKHIFHPIIGDRPHGCNKQNKIFLQRYNMGTMLLHAHRLKILHPVHGTPINIEAAPSHEFMRMLAELSLRPAYQSYIGA